MQISQRAAAIAPSVTLAVSAKAKAMKAAGEDVVSFGAGEPDFRTPSHICEAAKEAIDAGHHGYLPASGLPALKEAVADYLRRVEGLVYEPSEVIITAGGKYALFEACMATLNPGDEVILPVPYWVSYPEHIRLAGAEPVRLVAGSDQGFKITPDQLAAALTPRTRAFILNSPSNPTGVVYTSDELQALAEVVAQEDIWVFSDEIYNELVYDGVDTCAFATLAPSLPERTITFGGASKTWAMTGWRIGWAAGPADVIAAMSKLQSQSTSNATSIAQYAAMAAVSGSTEPFEAMFTEFDRRRLAMVERLEAMPGVRCVRPQGAFYCFPNLGEALDRILGPEADTPRSVTFAERLLEEAKVAVVPGAGFGDDACVRLSFAISMEDIEKGLDRIAALLKG